MTQELVQGTQRMILRYNEVLSIVASSTTITVYELEHILVMSRIKKINVSLILPGGSMTMREHPYSDSLVAVQSFPHRTKLPLANCLKELKREWGQLFSRF